MIGGKSRRYPLHGDAAISLIERTVVAAGRLAVHSPTFQSLSARPSSTAAGGCVERGYPAIDTASAWSATSRARRGGPNSGPESLGERHGCFRCRPRMTAVAPYGMSSRQGAAKGGDSFASDSGPFTTGM